jgi:hypothetical protein
VSVPVTGLEGSSEYTVCLVVENAGEEVVEGNTVSFTTMAASPVVEEQLTTSVGQETASLQALVNQELQETTCKDFQYGTTTSYGLLAGCEPEALGAGAGERTNANLTGLSANTEYHYRVLAENASGETQGADETFLTLPADPVVATAPATGVSPHGATLTGSVDPENTGHPEQDATSYFFQWGPTNAYGLQTPVPGGSLGEGNTAKPATAILGGLESGTSYHYRLVAVNDTNRTPQVVYGEDETFTTTATPPSLSPAAVSTTQTTATLTATLETQGLPTRYQLQAAVTGAAQQPLASGNTSTAGPLTISLANLSPGTTYQYTLTAENPNGPSNPATGTFTTTPATPPPAQLTLPPLIPYTPITQLTSREEQEDHHIKNIAPPPTQTQQLAKALKHCHTIKNPHTRHTCEKTAHKHHPTKTKRGCPFNCVGGG